MRTYATMFAVLSAVIAVGCSDAHPTDPAASYPDPGPVLEAADGAATTTRVPLETTLFNPCALDGVGELVDVTGTLTRVRRVILDQPIVHFRSLSQLTGVRGVGRTTGAVYRLNGTISPTQSANASASGTFVSVFGFRFRLVGPGPGNDMIVEMAFHFTVTPTGEFIITKDIPPTVSCR